jgi:hypothetical protein
MIDLCDLEHRDRTGAVVVGTVEHRVDPSRPARLQAVEDGADLSDLLLGGRSLLALGAQGPHHGVERTQRVVVLWVGRHPDVIVVRPYGHELGAQRRITAAQDGDHVSRGRFRRALHDPQVQASGSPCRADRCVLWSGAEKLCGDPFRDQHCEWTTGFLILLVVERLARLLQEPQEAWRRDVQGNERERRGGAVSFRTASH